jgi:hypothetical protein
VSGGGDILAHHGAALSNVNANDLLEFFLIAQIKGKIAADQDHDTIPQLNFRCNGQHAFSADPEERDVAREYLDLWHLEPDDGAMVELLDGWREELYGAPDIPRQARPKGARGDGMVEVSALPAGLGGTPLYGAWDVLPDGLQGLSPEGR